MNNVRTTPKGLVILTILLTFLLFTLASPGAAQQEPTPPPRDQQRTAPDREPVIVAQTMTPDGLNTVIAIPASADAYIASARPNENFGSDALFLGYNLVGSANFGAQRLLLHFDVESFVPHGSVIHGAAVNLRLSFSSPADDELMDTVLRRLASPWQEDTVTWNTEPAWTAVDEVASVGSALTWYGWDVTEPVEDWLTGLYPNYGIEIIGDETVQQRERVFYSRETTTSFYPQLVVDYTVSSDQTPPDVAVDPLPQFSRRSFTVSWSGADPGGSGISHYDVQVRVEGGDWQPWLTGVTQTEAEYGNGENGRFYEFRARGVDNVGNVQPFGAAEAATTVDTQAPTTTVDPLPTITNSDSFTVSWTGSDSVSGIHYYDVQYRTNDSSWTLWLSQTTATSAAFTGAADGLYEFEARAVDNVDQVELFYGTAEASIVVDSVAPFVEPKAWLPIIFNQP